jgi:hypothetical protein
MTRSSRLSPYLGPGLAVVFAALLVVSGVRDRGLAAAAT